MEDQIKTAEPQYDEPSQIWLDRLPEKACKTIAHSIGEHLNDDHLSLAESSHMQAKMVLRQQNNCIFFGPVPDLVFYDMQHMLPPMTRIARLFAEDIVEFHLYQSVPLTPELRNIFRLPTLRKVGILATNIYLNAVKDACNVRDLTLFVDSLYSKPLVMDLLEMLLITDLHLRCGSHQNACPLYSLLNGDAERELSTVLPYVKSLKSQLLSNTSRT